MHLVREMDCPAGPVALLADDEVHLAGTGVLSIGDQSGGGYLTVDAGSHALDLPLALLAPITMNVPASQTLALNGAVSGAGVDEHLHQHIVPRWSADANFFPIIARTKALPQLLGEVRRAVAEAWPTA